MTPDEMDKKIEFILQMQAQFETNVESLRISVVDLKTSVAALAGVVRDSIKISDDRFTRLDDGLRTLAATQTATDERLKQLATATDERLNRLATATDERLNRLAAATDERLNALISVVERHITGPHHAPRA